MGMSPGMPGRFSSCPTFWIPHSLGWDSDTADSERFWNKWCGLDFRCVFCLPMANMSCVFFRKYRNSFAHTNSGVPILELWRFEHTKDQVVQQPEILVNQEWVGDCSKWKRDFGRRGYLAWNQTKSRDSISDNMYEPEMNTGIFSEAMKTQ
jgi:hypothetical protein